MEDYDASMQALVGYQSLFVSLFYMVVCCSCGLKLLKACLIRCKRISCFRGSENNERRRSRSRNEAEDSSEREPRSYIARSGQVPDMVELHVRSNRVVNDEQSRAKAAKKLIEKLDHVVYDEDFIKNDEFGLQECAICMDEFKLGSVVDRIPSCKHFFHPECCQKWFESKIQVQEKKCPLCNKVVND